MSATILIVADRASLRRALQNWLEVMFPQCQVLEVAYREEALAAAQASLPQVIIMDLGFTTMNNLEAIASFKAAVPATQVVVLSNYEADDETYHTFVTMHGASGYLWKKAMLKELKPMLTELLFLSETTTPTSCKVNTDKEISRWLTQISAFHLWLLEL